MSVLSEERKRVILDQLDRYGKVKVEPLARQLQVSHETIRRDLDSLERLGKLKRVYGGAVKQSYQTGEPPYLQRQSLHQAEKQRIGKLAAELLRDGETVVIDTGTTTLELARSIRGRKRLTVLTNSLPVASLLTDSLNQGLFTGKIILLGGELNPEQQSISGPLCEKMLQTFHIDKAFISVGGVSLDSGISDYDIQEATVSRVMISVSKESIVLADQSKIGVQAFCRIASLEEIDVIVSDVEMPASWKAELGATGITWMTAKERETV
ncbi:DeoR/GlpR family DNA-binding transcription regulator [Effusibacillus pohliae]|uniref:DeoR/GlpR family DNA-binding transcription regulator n=1 Tax=Effusibacillus pohliae TaxID=232270 RepID=UPI00035D4287|nr:DeoR/GlpR family DNA-binding transcription regulator [Effusibacillus pohliae]